MTLPPPPSPLNALLVISHKRFRRTARGYETDGAFVLQMEALADYVEQLTLAVPVCDDPDFQGEWLTHPKVALYPLPDPVGRVGFLRAIPPTARRLRAALRRADLALIVHPSYLSLLARWLAARQGTPLVQWVVTDWAGGIRARRHDARLPARLAADLAARAADGLMRGATRSVLTFYTGRILYHRDDPGQRLRFSSSLAERELPAPRADASLSVPPRLLYVGRLAGEKGLPVLLEAVARLPDAELTLVGEGALEGTLRDQAAALGIAGRVTFRGFVPRGPDLWATYRQSDLFILPSLQEQQGKVLLEAMACGLPVIATEVGGLPEVLGHGERGLLVPPADSDALAAAIERLIGDEALREALRVTGLAWARARTVERETAHLVAEIEEALGTR